MAFEVGSIVARIKADVSDFKAGVKDAQDTARGLRDRMDNARDGSMALLGGVTAVAAGVTAFGVASFNAFNEANANATKLQTLMGNVKGATQEQTEALLEQADALQAVGVVEGDALVAGQAQLATFQLQSDSIAKLTPAMADMAAQIKGTNATSEDMVNIGNLVGKVMGGQVGALSRYGVSLSDAQAKQIAQGTEMEKAAVLAEVLEQNFGGVNEALRNTPEGKIAAAKQTFGDFMETIGEFIATLITPLIDGFNNWMTAMGGPEGMFRSLGETIQALMPWLQALGVVIAVALIPAVWGLATGIWAAMAPLLPFIALGAALVAAFVLLKNAGFDPLKMAVDMLKMAWDFLRPSIMALWDTIQNNLIPTLTALWERIAPVLIPVLKVLGAIIGGALIGAIWLAINVLNVIITIISTVIGVFIRFSDWVWRSTEDVRRAFGDIVGKISGALGGVWDAITAPFRKAFDWVKEEVGKVVQKLKDLNPFERHSPSLYDLVSRGTAAIKGEYEGMFDGIKNASFSATASPITAGAGVPNLEAAAAAGPSGGDNFTINLAGVMASSRADLRVVATDLVEAIDEQRRARGQQPILGNG